MDNFDPHGDALNARKMKGALKIVVSLDPETGEVSAEHADDSVDMDQDKPMVEDMLAHESGQDQADKDAAFAKDKEVIKHDAMGGISDEDTLNEFKDKAPSSLGQRVRLEIAKKGKA